MLTKKQNLLETIRGGNPDRFVNQFEFMELLFQDPFNVIDPYPEYGQEGIVNKWGVTLSWPVGTPGPFPVHDAAHKVLSDITKWKEVVKAPDLQFSSELWDAAIKEAESVDRNEKFAAAFMAPGLFERLHYLMGMEDALINFYEEPEHMHDLIRYQTEWEIQYAEALCTNLHPDALYHHDDWGSQLSTFISPEMFEEFFLDSYKELYGFYKSHGVELIIHHSDSYAATLVPYMIEMGVDIWQGVMTSNNLPELLKRYGGTISFMGGIDSASVDHPGWTRDEIHTEVWRACKEYGKKYFIPGASQGGPMSTFEGVYEALTEEIDMASKEFFQQAI